MLAIGRALMGEPQLLMLDEPSLGIAPKLISTIFEKIVEINQSHGITILLVEQNANLALEISHDALRPRNRRGRDARPVRRAPEQSRPQGRLPGRVTGLG
jgi:ABC-type branched-subunit amino acid transport system ATPase component